jgi:hypothetical protein
MANFYPATAAANAALLKQYKGSRPYIRKWHFPDYARLEQFPGYDGKMKMIFREQLESSSHSYPTARQQQQSWRTRSQ